MAAWTSGSSDQRVVSRSNSRFAHDSSRARSHAASKAAWPSPRVNRGGETAVVEGSVIVDLRVRADG